MPPVERYILGITKSISDGEAPILVFCRVQIAITLRSFLTLINIAYKCDNPDSKLFLYKYHIYMSNRFIRQSDKQLQSINQ